MFLVCLIKQNARDITLAIKIYRHEKHMMKWRKDTE